MLISSVGILGGIIIVYLLRNQKRKVAFGFGGSIILLGLILLAIAYGLISGIVVWIIIGSALIVFATSFYAATRKNLA